MTLTINILLGMIAGAVEAARFYGVITVLAFV